MEGLDTVLVFVRAAELGSFTRAAGPLGMTSSGVGKAVARLEADLGVRLLHRTTRRVALTDDGALFFEQCRRVLEDLEAARNEVSSRSAVLLGRLRVSLPMTIGRRVVIPALPRFVEQHPGVILDLRLTDRRVSLVEEGVDVALRVGALADSSLVARPIGRQRLLTLAAPGYLAGRSIDTLGDLALHRCLSFRMPTSGREKPWLFRAQQRTMEWSPRSFMVVDDGEALVAAAAAGLGVCQVPEYMMTTELQSGTLVEVLGPLAPPPEPIHAVYSSQRNLPARTRAFIDFLARLAGLGALPAAADHRGRPRRPAASPGAPPARR